MGIVVAYMVLAAQFNAFTHPLTVLLALPFSMSGALLMLYVFGQSMNVYSMLGLILLMGIAKKNSMMLVDFTNQIREKGVERHAALLQACPIRLRPILMTSMATIAGAMPAAYSVLDDIVNWNSERPAPRRLAAGRAGRRRRPPASGTRTSGRGV